MRRRKIIKVPVDDLAEQLEGMYHDLLRHIRTTPPYGHAADRRMLLQMKRTLAKALDVDDTKCPIRYPHSRDFCGFLTCPPQHRHDD